MCRQRMSYTSVFENLSGEQTKYVWQTYGMSKNGWCKAIMVALKHHGQEWRTEPRHISDYLGTRCTARFMGDGRILVYWMGERWYATLTPKGTSGIPY